MKKILKHHDDQPVSESIIDLENEGNDHRISLWRNIVLPSVDNSLINTHEMTEWESITRIRNSLIHNNGNAHETREITINSNVIQMNKGDMIAGKLDTFYNLTIKIIDLHINWLKNFLLNLLLKEN